MGDLTLHVSFFEIYCGKLYDLLNKRNLIHAWEDAKQRVKIMGSVESQCATLGDLMAVIDFGL